MSGRAGDTGKATHERPKPQDCLTRKVWRLDPGTGGRACFVVCSGLVPVTTDTARGVHRRCPEPAAEDANRGCRPLLVTLGATP